LLRVEGLTVEGLEIELSWSQPLRHAPRESGAS
jgi:hypothetical protein